MPKRIVRASYEMESHVRAALALLRLPVVQVQYFEEMGFVSFTVESDALHDGDAPLVATAHHTRDAGRISVTVSIES